MYDGQATYGAVTDNWPTIEPYFNETGSNCPSILPRAQQRELLELSVNSVKVCGHVQLLSTSLCLSLCLFLSPPCLSPSLSSTLACAHVHRPNLQALGASNMGGLHAFARAH